MSSENKNRKTLPEVIQKLFRVWRLQQSLTWRTLPQLSDFFQTQAGTVQAVVGGRGTWRGEQRLSPGPWCFSSAAATDDKCLAEYFKRKPQFIFTLYIKDKPRVHLQNHNPPTFTLWLWSAAPLPLRRATGKLQLHTDTEGFCSLVSWSWWESWEDEDKPSCSLSTSKCPWRQWRSLQVSTVQRHWIIIRSVHIHFQVWARAMILQVLRLIY